jgi:hypothetical protein
MKKIGMMILENCIGAQKMRTKSEKFEVNIVTKMKEMKLILNFGLKIKPLKVIAPILEISIKKMERLKLIYITIQTPVIGHLTMMI